MIEVCHLAELNISNAGKVTSHSLAAKTKTALLIWLD